MKMVKIINGTYGQRVNDRTVPVRMGGTCQVDDQEAERLVGLGVAAYVEEIPVFMPNQRKDGTGPEASSEEPFGPHDTLDIVEGHFTPDSLETMTKTDLAKLASDLGLDVRKCKNKDEMIHLISSADVQPDEEAPPDLTLGDVVV